MPRPAEGSVWGNPSKFAFNVVAVHILLASFALLFGLVPGTQVHRQSFDSSRPPAPAYGQGGFPHSLFAGFPLRAPNLWHDSDVCFPGSGLLAPACGQGSSPISLVDSLFVPTPADGQGGKQSFELPLLMSSLPSSLSSSLSSQPAPVLGQGGGKKKGDAPKSAKNPFAVVQCASTDEGDNYSHQWRFDTL